MCIRKLVNFSSAFLEPPFVFFFLAITSLIPKEKEEERGRENYEK